MGEETLGEGLELDGLEERDEDSDGHLGADEEGDVTDNATPERRKRRTRQGGIQ